ncbi:MAG TPA: SulP family inorganic anion transporter, partial [Xanthobacteraceae bacterium]|nr:SulP family inorganic anion transporter [Xanthobacteraceae bacterium]
MNERASRASSVVPALRWIRVYDGRSARLDVVAGLSLAAFVIPESLAYASLAQLPPVTGLYCYLVAGIAYALFGTSRQLAVGPTSSLAIVIATSVVALAGGDPARAVALASATALIVGLVCIAGRYVGLANAAYFISDPILLGFKAGAALTIASTQLPKLFGLEGVTGSFFTRVGHVAASLPQTHVPTLLFGLAAIALFLAFERALPGRPTTLVVVVAAIVAMAVFGLDSSGIKIVGELPSGLPGVGLPHIDASDVAALIPIALACFLLAFGEAISVARSFAQKHGREIDPEQELTALGAANIATGLAHGFPSAGGMSQTAVNDMAGATSPAALVVTSAAIGLTLLFFAKFFHDLPEPVLGAIVLIAASHLVKVEDLRRLRASSLVEFRISLLALAAVLFFGLLDGLLLAAAGSLVLLIARASRPAVVPLGREAATGRFV